MHWTNLETFLAMGGYAFYVWTSFGVTAAAILLELLLLRGRRKRLRIDERTISNDTP